MSKAPPSSNYYMGSPDAVDVKPAGGASYRQSWCKRRTSLERILIILLCLCLLGALVTIVVFAILSSSFTDFEYFARKGDICYTPHCLRTAARIKEAMDTTVDPCDDFFEYACGSWNNLNKIPDDRPNYNTFKKLDEEMQVQIKDLLEAPVEETDIIAIKNAKWLYESCLNEAVLEIRGKKPLLDFIDSLGGWPLLDKDWNADNFNLSTQLANLKLHNHAVLLNQWVSSDDKKSSVNIIQLDQGSLGLPSRDYFLKSRTDETLAIYEKLAVDIAKALGATENVEQQIKEMIDLEVQLANITIPEEHRRDNEAMYHRFTVAELYSNLTDKIAWHNYLKTMFDTVKIDITMNEPVVVFAPQYVIDLGTILENIPTRTLANYLMWQVVMTRANNLDKSFLQLKRDFHKALSGTEQDRARWKMCTGYANENFGMAVGRMYIEKHFDEKAKKNAVGLIEEIRAAFVHLLDEVTWMGEGTKEFAREKVRDIREKIGYPDYIKNDTALNEDFIGIAMDSEKYFENINNILQNAIKKNLEQLREPVDRDKWSAAPAVANAFYSASRNIIMFPAGILHPPFYHEDHPQYLNFGGIAMIIGHEITHGFDDKGRMYDKDGNMKQWWSEEDIENFKEKAQCIIDQYSEYTIPEVKMNINGKQTQGENIADNGGLKQAFQAYSKHVERDGPDQVLPGIKLTQNQLFFLSFAQMWCGSARPQNYVQSIRSGKHCPGKIRVRGTLSNSWDFAEAFNCPAGSKQNPVNKCSVW